MQVIGAVPQAVTAAEFKRAVHIDESETDDLLLFDALLGAAQEVVETATRRPMTQRQVMFTTWAGIGLRWWVPVAPVQAVTLVEIDTGTAWATVDSAAWRLHRAHDEPQVVFTDAAFGTVEELAGLQITATVGPQAVPKPLAQAVILLAKDWFDTGVAVEAQKELPMNFGCRSLIKQARYMRPCEWAAA